MFPDDSYLKERLYKASKYFRPALDDIRSFCIRVSLLETDNKEVKEKAKEASDELLTGLDIYCRTLELTGTGSFTTDGYNRIRTECILEDRSTAKTRKLRKIIRTEDEPGSVNEKLKERLQEWRSERFKKDNVPAYTIIHQSTLMDIAALIPKTKEELLRIKGFGDAKFKKYGEDILMITAEF
jgi:superfamily II DNA helicase RecQ